MINYGYTESTVRPDYMTSDNNAVWIATDIEEIEKENEGQSEKLYSYNLVQYSKDEYLALVQQQLIDTQLGMVEMLGMILGEEA